MSASVSAGSTSTQTQITTAVSSAQLLALNATPITLVAAQGVGTAIIIEQIIYEYNFVTTAYNTGAIGGTFYGTPVGASNASAHSDDEISINTSSTLFVGVGATGQGTYPRTTVENQPITFGAPTATGYGSYVGGDGTMTVSFSYRILTL